MAIWMAVTGARYKNRELIDFSIPIILIFTIAALVFVCWFYRGWVFTWLILGIFSISGLIEQAYDCATLHYHDGKSWVSLFSRKRTISQIILLPVLGVLVLVMVIINARHLK